MVFDVRPISLIACLALGACAEDRKPLTHSSGNRVGTIVFSQSAPPVPSETLDRFAHVPPARRASIEVGEDGRRTVRATVYEYALASASTRKIRCTANDDACVCTGVEDCNDLFAGKCRHPDTGGACVGESPVCVCAPRSGR